MNFRTAVIPGALYVTDTNNHVPAAAVKGTRPANPEEPDAPITGAVAAEQPWQAIMATEDAVLATVTASNWNGGTQQTSVALKAGVIIYGNFTQFQLASGKVVAYRAR
jgi:hypothetical protein